MLLHYYLDARTSTPYSIRCGIALKIFSPMHFNERKSGFTLSKAKWGADGALNWVADEVLYKKADKVPNGKQMGC